MKTVAKFTFPDEVEAQFLERLIAHAIAGARALHGVPRVRLGATYYIDHERPRCVIDVSTDVGECIATLFLGAVLRHMDERDVQVDRVSMANEGEVIP